MFDEFFGGKVFYVGSEIFGGLLVFFLAKSEKKLGKIAFEGLTSPLESP